MRNKSYRIILVTTFLSIVSSIVNAQIPASTAEPGVQVKTENPAAIRNLLQFVGRWEAEATMVMDGRQYSLNYWVEGKEAADGHALYADEGFTHPELGTMKGANLVGYDPYDAKIKWFSVDNMGTTHEHVGNWIRPDYLQIVHHGMREGKSYVETIDFNFTSPTDLTFHLVGTLDGVETERADGKFRKRPVDAEQKPGSSVPGIHPSPVKK